MMSQPKIVVYAALAIDDIEHGPRLPFALAHDGRCYRAEDELVLGPVAVGGRATVRFYKNEEGPDPPEIDLRVVTIGSCDVLAGGAYHLR